MASQTETNTISTLQTIELEDLSFPNLLPFPDDVLTAPLHRLSLSSLRTSPDESVRLFDASKELGFFYLDLRSDSAGEELLKESSELFELAPKLFGLGREELSKFDYSDRRSYFGYKGFGKSVADEKGNLDRNEFYNVCLPLALQLCPILTLIRYPRTIFSSNPKIRSPILLFSPLTNPSYNHISAIHTPSSLSSSHISNHTSNCPPQLSLPSIVSKPCPATMSASSKPLHSRNLIRELPWGNIQTLALSQYYLIVLEDCRFCLLLL